MDRPLHTHGRRRFHPLQHGLYHLQDPRKANFQRDLEALHHH